MPEKVQKLLFIDTNIWLDFYRARSDAGLTLLERAEAVADRIIVTYQLEIEFKKNRQSVMLDGMQELKAPAQVPRPGLFSDAKASKIMSRSLKEADKRVRDLRARFLRAVVNPSVHDPVYKACQRMFHKTDDLVLTRENNLRHIIRRRAFRRFLHGCPPRKRTDTSIGDAINWEWIVECAIQHNSEVVIVSRDTDYGVTIDNKAYINDHLKQEFTERVSKKRKVVLHNRLSDALRLFEVPVSKKMEQAETEIVEESAGEQFKIPATFNRLAALQSLLQQNDPRRNADSTVTNLWALGAYKNTQGTLLTGGVTSGKSSNEE
jgi:hypothetical protein